MRRRNLTVMLLSLAMLCLFQGQPNAKPCVIPPPADFKKALPALPGPDHWSVTICREGSWIFRIDGPPVDVRKIEASRLPGQSPAAVGGEHGNGIRISPKHTGTSTITADVIPRQGGDTIHITIDVTVINCNCP